ncbi:hypothetical protein [Murimonas intestini]|uniref:FMN-binding protein n=1 Tax=Murimonas intestini TaxID=1337051 RepID=A0AB73T0B0_9FIRM|nr:hypothetical protein [Murimonas intestini]MCR1843284.1 hypothetical protein [Murimonas intestini]MCR1868623.1 hypothetical protein [Murimonas intestini]MCR1885057.1 hypothetical protein [Murimonas intestini]
MSSKTKIMVFKMREVIYTGIFAVLGIILIVLMIIMFKPKKEAESAQTAADAAKYTAGVYTSGITIGDSAIDVEVVVDTSHINSIRLVNLSESVTTMYPLVQPALEDLASQIYESQTTDGITFSADSKYTSQILLDAIKDSLNKARVKDGSKPDKESADESETETKAQSDDDDD